MTASSSGRGLPGGDDDLVSIIECADDRVMRKISTRIAVKGLSTGKTLPAMSMDDFVDRFGNSAEMGVFLESGFRAGRQRRRGGR